MHEELHSVPPALQQATTDPHLHWRLLDSRGITLPTKVRLVKAMVFPVVMYGCESWTVKKAECWKIDVVLEKTLESPLDCKEIQPVHPKGAQSWIFIGRTDPEAETPILWPPDAKIWLIEKTLMLGGIGGRRRRGWQRMRWLDGITDSHGITDGYGFGWTPGVAGGQGGLACYGSWGHKELDTTEWLKWTELIKEKTFPKSKVISWLFFYTQERDLYLRRGDVDLPSLL